ncbi:MAG: response regulator [Ktedonobacteraceae bacterium]|nr:response regulator [Ktedonobacteraceae bacterium]
MAQVGLLEDNARIARLCATMLQYAGHEVIIYEHPRACLDELLEEKASTQVLTSKAKILPLDVLILDLNLPDISGLEVVRMLRTHQRTRSLPLIFCTAACSPEVNEALRLVPDASFLGKPFTLQDLAGVVSHAVTPKATVQ